MLYCISCSLNVNIYNLKSCSLLYRNVDAIVGIFSNFIYLSSSAANLFPFTGRIPILLSCAIK